MSTAPDSTQSGERNAYLIADTVKDECIGSQLSQSSPLKSTKSSDPHLFQSSTALMHSKSLFEAVPLELTQEKPGSVSSRQTAPLELTQEKPGSVSTQKNPSPGPYPCQADTHNVSTQDLGESSLPAHLACIAGKVSNSNEMSIVDDQEQVIHEASLTDSNPIAAIDVLRRLAQENQLTTVGFDIPMTNEFRNDQRIDIMALAPIHCDPSHNDAAAKEFTKEYVVEKSRGEAGEQIGEHIEQRPSHEQVGSETSSNSNNPAENADMSMQEATCSTLDDDNYHSKQSCLSKNMLLESDFQKPKPKPIPENRAIYTPDSGSGNPPRNADSVLKRKASSPKFDCWSQKDDPQRTVGDLGWSPRSGGVDLPPTDSGDKRLDQESCEPIMTDQEGNFDSQNPETDLIQPRKKSHSNKARKKSRRNNKLFCSVIKAGLAIERENTAKDLIRVVTNPVVSEAHMCLAQAVTIEFCRDRARSVEKVEDELGCLQVLCEKKSALTRKLAISRKEITERMQMFASSRKSIEEVRRFEG